MQLNKKQLEQAVTQQIISAEQANELYQFLQSKNQNSAQFSFTHLIYYLGGLVAIAAMTLFMSLSWQSYGGLGIIAIGLVYALIGFIAMNQLASKRLIVPAGICATFVVCLSPLFVFGVLQHLGLWPDEQHYWRPFELQNWHWLLMESATLLAGLAMLWRYKFPFLIMPIAASFWFVGSDVVAEVLGNNNDLRLTATTSIYTGLAMIVIAVVTDLRSRHTLDYAFWFYLLGVIAFWLGISLQTSDLELAKLGYFGINVIMILIGITLTRRVFVVCGALGVCFYLGYLAFDVFEDSWLFPFVMTAIGAGIIYLGILWQKYEQDMTATLRSKLPNALVELLDKNG